VRFDTPILVLSDKRSPSSYINDMPHPGETCAVDITVGVIGGRWKVLILQSLFDSAHRFSQLHRAVNGITEKVLTQQLRELEADGIISRLVFPSVPVKVEYSLTAHGNTLWPVLKSMHSWGKKQVPREQTAKKIAPKATKKEIGLARGR
jgi:DNA-binding HxlR family transcriptional regulator